MPDCICGMGEVKKHCEGGNAPDLKQKHYATCADEVVSIPAPDAGTHTVTGDFSFRQADAPNNVEAGALYPWNVSKNDGSFKSTKDENGRWNTEVKYFVPYLSSEKSYVFSNLAEDNDIHIVNDLNGKRRIVGSVDNPANTVTEETTTPKNGYIITITWQSAKSPYFYEGAVPQ